MNEAIDFSLSCLNEARQALIARGESPTQATAQEILTMRQNVESAIKALEDAQAIDKEIRRCGFAATPRRGLRVMANTLRLFEVNHTVWEYRHIFDGEETKCATIADVIREVASADGEGVVQAIYRVGEGPDRAEVWIAVHCCNGNDAVYDCHVGISKESKLAWEQANKEYGNE